MVLNKSPVGTPTLKVDAVVDDVCLGRLPLGDQLLYKPNNQHTIKL